MMRAAADLGNRCAAARLPANCSVSRLALFVGVFAWMHGGDHARLLMLLVQQLNHCTALGGREAAVRAAPHVAAAAAAAAPQPSQLLVLPPACPSLPCSPGGLHRAGLPHR